MDMLDTNYFLKSGEGIDSYNQRIAAYNASKNSAASSTTAPSIASLYGNVSDNDKYVDSSLSYYKGIAETPVDEDAIRANTMRALQTEIDATNRLYADKLNEAKQQGIGRIGSGNAIQSRRGLIGSDFGAAQGQQIIQQNNEIEGGIRNENAVAIAAITGRGNAMAKEEIAAKNAARQKGAEAYLQYLSESDSRRANRTTEAAKRALAAGFDLSSADDASIKTIADSYQISPDTLRMAYKEAFDAQTLADEQAAAKAAKDALDADLTRSNIAKNGRIELSEGAAVYDANGKRIAYNPKTYAPDVGGGLVNGVQLTAKQKTDYSSLNSVVAALDDYRTLFEKTVNSKGGALYGAEAARLKTAKANLEFAVATAVGTGALQAPDRAVVEDMIPNPTSLSGAFSQARFGGKTGGLNSIDQVKALMLSRRDSITSGTAAPVQSTQNTVGEIIVAPDGTEVQILD